MEPHAWLVFVVLAAVSIAAGVTDARTGQIPNRLTYAAVLIGLAGWSVYGLVTAGGSGLTAAGGDALIATGLGLGLGLVAFALGGLGGGDAKLMAAIGAVSADWRLTLAAIVYGVAIAAIMAIVVMVRRGLVKQTFTVMLGAALSLRRVERPTLPGGSPTVPFGVALAAGAVIAGVEHLLAIDYPWSG